MTPDRATLRANLHLLDDKQTVFHAQSYQLFDVDPRLADVLEQLENAPALAGHFDSSRFSGELEALQHLDSAGRGDIQSDLEGIRHRSRCYYLFVTQECNLRCLYCYGDGGSYHKSMIPMQDDTLANFFERCITDKDMTYDLVFFGGEPLLNFPLLKKAVALGDEKRAQGFTLHYTLVTNGSISTPEVTRFLAEHIERVTVSLDGPKDYHDQQRPGKTRFSSHDRALKTLRKFRDVGMRTVVRTIITKLNYREVEDIYRYNLEANPAGVGITPVDVPTDSPMYLTAEEYRLMADEISRISCENLYALSRGEDTNCYEFTHGLIERLLTGRKRFFACGAGRAQYAVAADGDAYPCHRFVGMTGYCLGNVNDDIFSEDNFELLAPRFDALSVENIEACKNCWARYLCGGCCYLQSSQYKGRMDEPLARYCYFKKRVFHDLLTCFADIARRPDDLERLQATLARTLHAIKEELDPSRRQAECVD